MKKGDWLSALQGAGVEAQRATEALQIKGWLSTGNYALNWAISGRLCRGYPLGHTCEIFGDPGTGKSFLAARALAMAQEQGGVALLDDTEGAYNAQHSARLGINTDKLAVVSSATVKEHLRVAQGFLKVFADSKYPVGVLVVDSLAQLSTEHEQETQLDKRDMTKAAELKATYRLIGNKLNQLPVIHLATNHTIANIGNMFNQRTTPGGGGPKFSATIRLDMRTVSKIKKGTDYSGVICTVFVDKNRIAAPWKRVQMAIPFDKPISPASGLVPVLLGLGVLQEQGQHLVRGSEKIARAYSSKGNFLEQDESGERVLDMFPDILTETDAALEAGTLQAGVVMEAVSAEEETE